MKSIYLFDVDGTLTPAKGNIDVEFAKELYTWMNNKQIYIVSGGSFPRIVNQLGRDIIDQTRGVFACMGNAFYKKIKDKDGYSSWNLEYENKFRIQKPALFFSELERYVMNSEYHTKTGRHYEERVGMVNFSIVGRNATKKQRKEYEEYDKVHQERKDIVTKLSKKHPTLDFVIGGAVSIDIFNKGNDKSQVIDRFLKDVWQDYRVLFVGDRVEYPGNDYSLAKLLDEHENGKTFGVETWQDTQQLLKTKLFASS